MPRFAVETLYPEQLLLLPLLPECSLARDRATAASVGAGRGELERTPVAVPVSCRILSAIAKSLNLDIPALLVSGFVPGLGAENP